MEGRSRKRGKSSFFEKKEKKERTFLSRVQLSAIQCWGRRGSDTRIHKSWVQLQVRRHCNLCLHCALVPTYFSVYHRQREGESVRRVEREVQKFFVVVVV